MLSTMETGDGSEKLAESVEAVLRRLGRAIDATDRAGAPGLTPAQAEAIRFAATVRPDVATVGQLARVLGVRHATAIGILRPLVERGLVRREPHPYDRRQQVLALTDAGREVYASLSAATNRLQEALAPLSDEERARVEEGLRVLVGALQRSGALVVAAPCAGCIHFQPGVAPGSPEPHRCALIRRSLSEEQSRMLCPEHTEAA